MYRRGLVFVVVTATLAATAYGQSTDSGISVPITVSAGAMYSERRPLVMPGVTPVTGGMRAMLYPSIKLGSNWFGYTALQVRQNPYFYYDAYDPNYHSITDVIQAYAGYTLHTDRGAVVLKAGRMATAFGSFPLRYDEMQNPLLDQPLSYVQSLTLRHDQLPCGVADLKMQFVGSVGHFCGGTPGRKRGMTPVTLYGLPGAEVDLSFGRVDARFQLAGASPVYNDVRAKQVPSYLQWSAGGGYSIRQGFRIGASAFRGPYLNEELQSALPAGKSLRDYPATGIGTDVQFNRGRLSLSGEIHRFVFSYPSFTESPSLLSAYVESKVVLTPRFFLAARVGRYDPGRVTDTTGASLARYAGRAQSYETGAGYWLNRRTLVKTSYEWYLAEGRTGNQLNVAGVQLVYTLPSVSLPFHK